MTQLFLDPTPGPGTHAIVVGAGKYEPSNWGLPDLDSAVHSAQAVVNWLINEARHPAAMAHAPLKSIDVLISSPAGALQVNDAAGNPVALEVATMANLEQAIKRWFHLGNQNFESQMLFYFCGHGLQKGLSKYLLLDGFADPQALSVANDAVDFDSFVLGMERCRARRQIYFLDCCRSILDKALKIPAALGKAIIDPDYSQLVATEPRDWPVFCAAAGGLQAFGAPGHVSRFTAALLKALRGCAWDEGRQVTTDTLATYIDQLLKFEEAVRFAPAQFAKKAGESVDIPLFQGPNDCPAASLPVLIGCEVSGELPTTSFTVTGGTIQQQDRAASQQEWELLLPKGVNYQLSAQNGGAQRSKAFNVRPACQIIRI